MKRENLHIHSNYSFDSKMSLETIAQMLIEDDIYYGGITDHVDFKYDKSVTGVINNLKLRNKEIDEINKKYHGKVKLLKAVEIGSPHLYKKEVEALSELDFDYIMGSIHDINRDAKTNTAKRSSTYAYYEEMLEMIEANQIDVVGHIDYINRYYGADYSDGTQLNKIFYQMKVNNIITEVNTSASRRIKELQPFFPSIPKIKAYSRTHDKVIIGSDAHEGIELLDNLDKATRIAGLNNLRPVIFEKRKVKELNPPTHS